MDYKDAIKQFECYQESGWSKSEVPNSACLVLALDALRAEQRCRQLEAESAAMRGALEPIYEFIQENIHGDNFKPMIGRAKEALAPDAGKDLLERVQRLEAVAEAAKFLFKLNQHGCTSQIGENELAKALAALEGGK